MRSIAHGSFTVERRYDAPAARVFEAWTDPDQIREWAAPVEGWTFAIRAFDFRVGGGEHFEFGPPGSPPCTHISRFDDIVPGERIVSAYALSQGAKRISSSVMCVELVDEGAATLVRVTEHGAFFDGLDTVQNRKGGTLQTLAQLQAILALKTWKKPPKPTDDKPR